METFINNITNVNVVNCCKANFLLKQDWKKALQSFSAFLYFSTFSILPFSFSQSFLSTFLNTPMLHLTIIVFSTFLYSSFLLFFILSFYISLVCFPSMSLFIIHYFFISRLQNTFYISFFTGCLYSLYLFFSAIFLFLSMK